MQYKVISMLGMICWYIIWGMWYKVPYVYDIAQCHMRCVWMSYALCHVWHVLHPTWYVVYPMSCVLYDMAIFCHMPHAPYHILSAISHMRYMPYGSMSVILHVPYTKWSLSSLTCDICHMMVCLSSNIRPIPYALWHISRVWSTFIMNWTQ